jgi:D-3-phosphoglycerate dehydrogenase
MATRLSVAKDKLKFVLLEGIHESALDVLRQDGYTNIVAHAKALSGEALAQAVADAHFLGIRSRTQLTEAVLEAAPKLVAVGAFCIGTNQIDLQAAMRRGSPVFNAPFSNTRSVAELVLAEIVMLMRGIPQKNALLHRGGWSKSAAGSFEVRGKTLGIVGYGHIGTQIGVLAEQLGMRVLFHDIEAKLTLGNARQVASLDELLQAADVLSLHVPEHSCAQGGAVSRPPGRVRPPAVRGSNAGWWREADAALGHRAAWRQPRRTPATASRSRAPAVPCRKPGPCRGLRRPST